MKTYQVFGAIGILAAAAFVAADARAVDAWSNGYVCSVTPRFDSSSQGSYGALWVEFTATASCSGTSWHYVICSSGATSTACNATFRMTEAGLHSTFLALVHAASAKQPVKFYNQGTTLHKVMFISN